MIKYTVLALVLVMLFDQTALLAQEKGKFRLGVSAALGTQVNFNETIDKVSGFGATATVDYFATDAFAIALSYTYFFTNTVESVVLDITQETSTIDLDAKYLGGPTTAEVIKEHGVGNPIALSNWEESTVMDAIFSK